MNRVIKWAKNRTRGVYMSLTLNTKGLLFLTAMFYYLKLFRFLSTVIHKFVLTRLYQAYVLPKIEYSNIIYIHSNSKNRNTIEKINSKLLLYTSITNKSDYNIDHRSFISACKFFIKISIQMN